jgi:hypothetical protein
VEPIETIARAVAERGRSISENLRGKVRQIIVIRLRAVFASSVSLVQRIPQALILVSLEVETAYDIVRLDLPFDGFIGFPTVRQLAELIRIAQIISVLSSYPLLEAGAGSLGKTSSRDGDRHT